MQFFEKIIEIDGELGGVDSKWFSHSIHRPGCLHRVGGKAHEFIRGMKASN